MKMVKIREDVKAALLAEYPELASVLKMVGA